MKKIGKIKLKEIVKNPLDSDHLSKIRGGVQGIMPVNYGCYNNVCINNSDNSSKECTVKKCENTACSSGA